MLLLLLLLRVAAGVAVRVGAGVGVGVALWWERLSPTNSSAQADIGMCAGAWRARTPLDV